MVKEKQKFLIRPCDLNKNLFHPRGDLDSMLEIEKQSYDDPWDENTITYFLKLSGAGCFVIEVGSEIAGFLLFEIQKSYLNLVSVAIDPKFRRQGFASLLVKELIQEDLPECKRVFCTVSDRNLQAHLFLNKFGFKAIKMVKDFFSEGHDAYEFMYLLKKKKKRKPRDKNDEL